MSLKKAAEELLVIADSIEKQAAEATSFICADCNHTASLAKINAARTDAAKAAGENVVVSGVTVNDSVACPACLGIMSYVATEASEAYYYNEKAAEEEKEEEEKEEKEAAAKEEEKEEETEEEEKAASIDYDKLDRYLNG